MHHKFSYNKRETKGKESSYTVNNELKCLVITTVCPIQNLNEYDCLLSLNSLYYHIKYHRKQKVNLLTKLKAANLEQWL